jgi:hypothetical protein
MEDNIKMDLHELGGADKDWIDLSHDRYSWRAFVNAAMNFGFHKMRGIA